MREKLEREDLLRFRVEVDWEGLGRDEKGLWRDEKGRRKRARESREEGEQGAGRKTSNTLRGKTERRDETYFKRRSDRRERRESQSSRGIICLFLKDSKICSIDRHVPFQVSSLCTIYNLIFSTYLLRTQEVQYPLLIVWYDHPNQLLYISPQECVIHKVWHMRARGRTGFGCGCEDSVLRVTEGVEEVEDVDFGVEGALKDQNRNINASVGPYSGIPTFLPTLSHCSRTQSHKSSPHRCPCFNA